MSEINKKEYLKKYLSGDKEKGKKKKHKKKAKTGPSRVKIIDDDADYQTFNEAVQEDLQGLAEDAPQIVGVIDDRPLELRMDDFKKDSAWTTITINDDDSDNSPPRRNRSPSLVKIKVEIDEESLKHKKNVENSNKRNYNGEEIGGSFARSPPRRKRRKDSPSPRRNNKDNDTRNKEKSRGKDEHNSNRKSEDRTGRNKSNEHSRSKGRNYSYSPTRRRRDDKDNRITNGSSPRRQNEDNNPPRRSYDNDNSPPRKQRNDDDHSPPRRKMNDDNNPSRRNDNDNSPPRRRKINEDSSPPRRNRDNDRSSLRSIKIEDSSPPRRIKVEIQSDEDGNTMSPPRHIKHEPASPPNIDLTQRSTNSDLSPPRQRSRAKDKSDKNRKSRWGESSEKMTKTLDGKAAGLQNAKDLVVETQSFKKREDDLFKNMSAEVSGANAVTIMRDRKTGRIRDLGKEAEEKQAKDKEYQAVKEKYDRWGKGTKQVDDYNEKLQQDAYEMSKPLARYADDEDLETYLKEQEREGDPMLAYIRKKKKKDAVETGKPSKPQFEGEFMPNRFGIRPGHKWDGVDRSNGYEKKWFEVLNEKHAQREEAYRWNSEDM